MNDDAVIIMLTVLGNSSSDFVTVACSAHTTRTPMLGDHGIALFQGTLCRKTHNDVSSIVVNTDAWQAHS